MCYTVSGKAKIDPADTRLEKPCKARKKTLSRHNFWLCSEVDRSRSTEVDLLRPSVTPWTLGKHLEAYSPSRTVTVTAVSTAVEAAK